MWCNVVWQIGTVTTSPEDEGTIFQKPTIFLTSLLINGHTVCNTKIKAQKYIIKYICSFFYDLFSDVASNLRIYSIKWKVDDQITKCEGYERKWSWKVTLHCLYYTREGTSVTFQYRYYIHYKEKYPLCMKDMVAFYVSTTVYSKYNFKQE